MSVRNFSCKNKDSAFLLFLIIFPDPYFFIHAAVGKQGFRRVSMFLVSEKKKKKEKRRMFCFKNNPEKSCID